MAYLFDRINADLEDRIRLAGEPGRRWLTLDFLNSPLRLPGEQVIRYSLLEGDNLQQIQQYSDQRFDAAVINLQLAWTDYVEVFKALHSVLVPGGRLFFCTLGPDTLFELREAWRRVDQIPHVHPFVDLHHLGDKLLRAGFDKPILDADWLGVEYDDLNLLMQDLRNEGLHNVLDQRRKTLTGKARFSRFRDYFESNPGPVQITFELIFGYAEIKTGGIKVNPPGPI